MESDELLALVAELVSVPSVSHHEAALADLVESRLGRLSHLELSRLGDNVVARTRLGRARRVVLAGHLDTVPPPEGADPAAVAIEGDRLVGLGAADMKGGLAVMLWLAEELRRPAFDLSFVFYACEEVEARFNGLGVLAEAMPEALVAEAAILLEPTSAVVEAGCQGTLRMGVTLRGRRAHTARPHMGRNAIHRLAPVIEAVAAFEAREPLIDGCRYREALQLVSVGGGVAANVVPDEARVVLNHRFAPDRSPAEAEAGLRELLAPHLEAGDSIEVLDVAQGAPPSLSEPLFAALVGASGSEPRAKLGWTDVARFAAAGVPAVNFGPGDPSIAHMAGEWVQGAELQTVAATLSGLLGG